MHKKWSNIISQNKAMISKIKNSSGVQEYFSNKPESGYMFDNISKKTVLIKDCKTSTLRRYDKLINKYYTLVTTPNERKELADKLSEVQKELLTRND